MKTNAPKILLALVLLAGASYLAVRHFTRPPGVTEQAFFYDLSERKLFAAPLQSDPPIKGLNNDERDAVRAVVISTSADPRDKSGQRIAYLEQYAPELIAHLAKVRAGQAEPFSSKVRNGYRLVKRPSDPSWHTVASPEGQQILSEWNRPGPDGKFPAVCSP